jgi:hypothetical protein
MLSELPSLILSDSLSRIDPESLPRCVSELPSLRLEELPSRKDSDLLSRNASESAALSIISDDRTFLFRYQ